MSSSSSANSHNSAVPPDPNQNPDEFLQELKTTNEYMDLFERLVSKDASQVFYPQLVEIMKHREIEGHFGVYIDAKILLNDNPQLGHSVLRYPEQTLSIFSTVLRTAQQGILEQFNGNGNMTIKKNVHARVNWLPGANRKPNVSAIRSIDVNVFIQLSGRVVRSSTVKILEYMRVFECNNPSCDEEIKVYASKHEVGNVLEKPSGSCPGCRRSSSYTERKEKSVCHDYREIKVQEQVQKLGIGSIPRSITVILLHDLVSKSVTGDDVVITGIPIHRWQNAYCEERCNLETVIEANTIEVVNASVHGAILSDEMSMAFDNFWKHWTKVEKRPMTARSSIISSICPQLYGLFRIKLAMALCLVGCETFLSQGSQVRGEPHILLVGDPGTGKSQFLRFAAKVAHRSILTTGTGTTSAGLTCSTTKEGHEYVLEAGALVLADRGICCIDEFSSIRKHDRASIHEAMEQQTIHFAKAGLVVALKTRASVLAATNPKGKYDPNIDLSTNTGIATPLLSRFDMVFIMLDKADQGWDRIVSEFILRAHAKLENDHPLQESISPGDSQPEYWDVEKLQGYLTYVKRLQPYMTKEAAEVLTSYYKSARKNFREAGRATVRLLESLLRLAKAHARLMARRAVIIVDAVVSISLVSMSFERANGEDSLAQMNFPPDPDEYMVNLTIKILNDLCLDHLIPEAGRQWKEFHVEYESDSESSSNEDSEEENDPKPINAEKEEGNSREESQDELEKRPPRRTIVLPPCTQHTQKSVANRPRGKAAVAPGPQNEWFDDYDSEDEFI